MKKWNEWTKKQKMTLGVALAVVIVGGAVGTKVYANNQHQKSVETALETIKKEKLTLEQLQQAVDELRDKENPNFLAKNVDLKALESIEKQLDQLKKGHVTDSLSELKKDNKEVVTLIDEVDANVQAISYQLMTQTKVSQLFTVKDKQYVIQGSDFMLDLPTADDLAIGDIEAVVNATRSEGKLMTIPESTDAKKSWEQAIEALTSEATKQVTLIEDSQKEVAALFKDKKPVDTTDKKKIDALRKKIEGIRNEKAKNELLAQLKQVEEAVNKKEKADADKKAKEDVAKSDVSVDTKGIAPQGDSGSGQTDSYDVNGNLNNSNWSDQSSQGGGGYNPPASNNGGGYTPPTNNGGGGYNPPANNGGGNSSSSNNGGDYGYADQDQLNKNAEDASNADWSDFFK